MDPRLRRVARTLASKANTPVARRRTARAWAVAPRPARLELGGLVQRPGWLVTNVNAVARHYLDATREWPFEDASLSHVYADNMIEHVSLDQGRAVLAEAFRCLQPGGLIRLVTPDIAAHVQLYLSGTGALTNPAAVEYREAGLTVEHPVDIVRIPIGEFGHHTGYVYDYTALAAELTAVGFGECRQLAVGESDHPEFADIEVRASHGVAQMAVEARR